MGGGGLWTSKRNSLLYASPGKEEEVWNGFELTLSKNWSSLGMTEKASLGFVLISPSFRKCDKQDHTGSQIFWIPGVLDAIWSLVICGPAISSRCVLSQDQACWF